MVRLRTRAEFARTGVLILKRDRLATWLYVVLGALCASSVMYFEPNLLEEGLIVHFAGRMVGGEQLYEDLVFFTGPLPFEVLALMARLFGNGVEAGRGVVVLLAGLCTGAFYQIVRSTEAGWLTHLATWAMALASILLFPMLSLFFYSTIAMYLAVLATYCAVRSNESFGWAFACGCAMGAVALTKQNVGLVLILGLFCLIGWTATPSRRFRIATWVAGGGLFVFALVLIRYGVQGNLWPFIDAVGLMPFRLGESFGSPYINFIPVGSLDSDLPAGHYLPWAWSNLFRTVGPPSWPVVTFTQILYGLPGLALGMVIFRHFLLRKTPNALFYLSALVVALWVQMYPRADWGHLVYALPVSFGLLVATVAPWAQRMGRPFAGALATSGLFVLVGASAWMWLTLEGAAGPPFAPPFVKLRPVSPVIQNPDFRRVIDYLRQSVEPGEFIWVARAEPLLYEATATQNPTRYGGVMPGLTDIQDPELLRTLGKVRYVVMSDADSPNTQYLRESLPETQKYLEQHFSVPNAFIKAGAGVFVLRRGPDRGATLVDLYSQTDLGRRFVRDFSGRRSEFRREPLKFETRFNRRPLAVPVGAQGGGIDYSLQVPADAVLEFSLGVGALFVGAHPFYQVARSRFDVFIKTSGDFERLFSISYDQMRREDSGKWTDYQIDLSRWGGESATLRFEVVPEGPQRRLGVAWWGSPRLIERGSSQGIRTP